MTSAPDLATTSTTMQQLSLPNNESKAPDMIVSPMSIIPTNLNLNPLQDREERKRKLIEMREKLRNRKKQREQLRISRTSTINSNEQFGKKYVDSFVEQLNDTSQKIQANTRQSLQEDKKEEKQKEKKEPINKSSLYRKPGRRCTLSQSAVKNTRLQKVRRVQTFNKSVSTDPNEFNRVLREDFPEDFDNDEFDDYNEIKFDDRTLPPTVNRSHLRTLSTSTAVQEPLADEVWASLMESQYAVGWPRECWEMLDVTEPSPAQLEMRQFQLNQQYIDEEENKRKEIVAKRRAEKLRIDQERKNRSVLAIEDANALIDSGTFLKRFRTKCRWIERTLGINEEQNEELWMKSATEEKSNGIGTRNYPRLKLKKIYANNKVQGRPVGHLDWCTTNKDWFLTSYLTNADSYSVEPDGCINIWNILLSKYPEYVLYSRENTITTAYFHPIDPFLIYGSTMSGQILQWDLRINKRDPFKRSNFSDGHSAPVFCMDFLPSMNQKFFFLSVSNDGKLCMWRDEVFDKPVNAPMTLKPDEQKNARPIEIATTCFSYSNKDPGQIALGSDEGYIYFADIYTQQKEKSPIKDIIRGAHYGPITNIQYHQNSSLASLAIPRSRSSVRISSEYLSELFLSSSYDWSVKLWHKKYSNLKEQKDAMMADHMKTGGGSKLKTKKNKMDGGGGKGGSGSSDDDGNGSKMNFKPIQTFNQMTDYIYDVKWSKGGKPGVFACADGEGKISVFNLAENFKEPICTPIQIRTKNAAATKLEWSRNGKYLICGDSEGVVSMYSVHSDLCNPQPEDYEDFEDAVKRNINAM